MSYQKPHQDHNQQPGELDRILTQEDALLPSSGFALSVMEAIREEATAPAPIPFPWKLALPGIAALIAVIVMMVRYAGSALHSSGESAELLSKLQLDTLVATSLSSLAGPVLLALAATLLSMLLCRRLAGGWSAR